MHTGHRHPFCVPVAHSMAQESWNCDTAEGSGCQQQEGLVQCTNNCGFFGCAATMNLCSQCFRELSLKKQGNPGFAANSPEKVAAAMAASAEKSFISSSSEKTLISAALSEKSMMSPTYSPISTLVGSENPFAKSVFSLPSSTPTDATDLPLSLPLPVTVESTSEEELVLPSASASSPAHAAPSSDLPISDLAPIAALFAPDCFDLQPVARRRGTNKCLTCKKRTGLLGFKCRCGDIFCATHRYSDKHACPFDYKSAGREAIAKANPVVKAPKVERI